MKCKYSLVDLFLQVRLFMLRVPNLESSVEHNSLSNNASRLQAGAGILSATLPQAGVVVVSSQDTPNGSSEGDDPSSSESSEEEEADEDESWESGELQH
jgi:hypothetical protein